MVRRIVLVGGSGVIGRILTEHLAGSTELIVVDPRPPADERATWVDAQAEQVPGDLFHEEDVVVFLATGADGGWEGLERTEIIGLRHVAEAAASAHARRLVYASSNHAVGGYEQDLIAHGYPPVEPPAALVSEVRPDSEYGVAKAFGEAYLRYLAEKRRLRASVLRIGTVRAVDDPDVAVRQGEADFLPLPEATRLQRFRATWLRHPDLVNILQEEIRATAWFRRRFAVSGNPGRFWPLAVEEWDGH